MKNQPHVLSGPLRVRRARQNPIGGSGADFCGVNLVAHARTIFTPDEVASMQPQELNQETLGVLVSAWTAWEGAAIMAVFQAALEDANYHDQAAIVEDWLAKEGVDRPLTA